MPPPRLAALTQVNLREERATALPVRSSFERAVKVFTEADDEAYDHAIEFGFFPQSTFDPFAVQTKLVQLWLNRVSWHYRENIAKGANVAFRVVQALSFLTMYGLLAYDSWRASVPTEDLMRISCNMTEFCGINETEFLVGNLTDICDIPNIPNNNAEQVVQIFRVLTPVFGGLSIATVLVLYKLIKKNIDKINAQEKIVFNIMEAIERNLSFREDDERSQGASEWNLMSVPQDQVLEEERSQLQVPEPVKSVLRLKSFSRVRPKLFDNANARKLISFDDNGSIKVEGDDVKKLRAMLKKRVQNFKDASGVAQGLDTLFYTFETLCFIIELALISKYEAISVWFGVAGLVFGCCSFAAVLITLFCHWLHSVYFGQYKCLIDLRRDSQKLLGIDLK